MVYESYSGCPTCYSSMVEEAFSQGDIMIPLLDEIACNVEIMQCQRCKRIFARKKQ